tara:strand:+ start:53 stop:361 length:309 start_codon:yes stop_codon:yes gene_type:complete
MNYIYWRWSKNESVPKSERKYTNREIQKDSREPVIEALKKHRVDFSEHLDNKVNKREECSNRISDRDWIIQTNVNPYLTNNNYMEDLNAQNKFLIPQNSNYE